MPIAKPVVAGDCFGRLTVLRELESVRSPNGTVSRIVECRCECGTVRGFRLPLLRNGKTKSCGCLARELAVERGHKYGGGNKSHGCHGTLEYTTWVAMRQRCTNPNNMGWPHYGGRGIEVCGRWMNSFPLFLEDMGRRPGFGYSIHRVDNDGNYEPENCVWATSQEQARNRRNTLRVEHNGEQVLLVELAASLASQCEVPEKVIYNRLRAGWSAERVMEPHDRGVVEFHGELVPIGELALRFGHQPCEIRSRMKRGMSLEEALTPRKDDSDGFYRTPLSQRDHGWYREYERREAARWASVWAKLHDLDERVFLSAYLASEKPTVNGRMHDAIREAQAKSAGN